MAKAMLSAIPNKLDIFSFVLFIHDEDAAVAVQTCYHLGHIPNVLVSDDSHGVESEVVLFPAPNFSEPPGPIRLFGSGPAPEPAPQN
jgi:hypothetical protein